MGKKRENEGKIVGTQVEEKPNNGNLCIVIRKEKEKKEKKKEEIEKVYTSFCRICLKMKNDAEEWRGDRERAKG